MNIKNTFKQATGDRNYLIALILSGVVLLAILVLSAIEIRPSELQVPIRNTVFGITFTYREQWYNELAFVGLALLMGAFHTLIALKLYALKDRRYGIAFQWLTVIMLGITFLMLVAIFKVIAVVK